MRICNQVRSAGEWDESAAADNITLDFDGRHRRRVAMVSEGGLSFLLDLPRAIALRSGDGLVLDDGTIVGVTAAPERLVEITASNLAGLVRIAWHLGNRHLPTQLFGNRLRIREDHVIQAMVEGLGGSTSLVQASFDPEGGAFGGGALAHGHHHGGTT